MQNHERFEQVLYAVPNRICQALYKLSPTVKANANEIRMRQGLPLALTVGTETVFVDISGQTHFHLTQNLLQITEADVEETFRRLCNNSVYAHEKELKNGYIVMKNGSRAGVCGSFGNDGCVYDISSINIRIAREIFGSANDITRHYINGGILIAGAPGSGKTTILRDLVRQLSNGVCGRLKRIAVVDSRCEISGTAKGKSVNDLGVNTDILITEEKSKGIEIALRTMFPHVIAFDEIATVEELKKVSYCFCAGVDIITTAHIGSCDELKTRRVTSALLKSGAIDYIAMLPRIHGGKIKIINVKDFLQNAAI